jgi:hypothetical protein
MKLKCQCCGIEEEFQDGEEAFKKGWDAPPHFLFHVTCNLCPAVCVVMGAPHDLAHDLWSKEGRPEHFSVAKCGVDTHMKKVNNPTSTGLDKNILLHLSRGSSK